MRLFFLCMVMMLAACQSAEPPVEQAPPAPVVEVATVAPEPVVAPPPKPRFIIDNIMTLAPDTLQSILGEPSLIRVEKKARVWLYHNQECVLHLYFYPDDNGDFRLNYVETEAVGLAVENPTVSPNACLDSFVVAESNGPVPKEDPQPFSDDKDKGPQPDM